MNAQEIIAKKKRGESHTREELEWFLGEFIRGHIADYQVAAWLMAVCLRGMAWEETWHLTEVLATSKETLTWQDQSIILDKHSTGGVGDTTTLIVVPLVASLGQPMVKLSGRGLGHTGGTIDKLASIPGLSTRLDPEDMRQVLKAVGMVIAGHSQSLAPADGLLYQLRDVTATVDSIPLIAASIMSKKIALGAGGLVLDVKTGSGALMASLAQAQELSDTMLHIARQSGIRACALISDMNQPLGQKIGNALEVEAALEVLSGGGSPRLRWLSLELAASLLALGSSEGNRDKELRRAQKQLDGGGALEQFLNWVRAQGGKLAGDEKGYQLQRSREKSMLTASSSGFVHQIDAKVVGQAAVMLGAGRQRKEDPIDPGAGIILEVEVGSPVVAQQPLAWLFGDHVQNLARANDMLEKAFVISKSPVTSPPLLLEQRK